MKNLINALIPAKTAKDEIPMFVRAPEPVAAYLEAHISRSEQLRRRDLLTRQQESLRRLDSGETIDPEKPGDPHSLWNTADNIRRHKDSAQADSYRANAGDLMALDRELDRSFEALSGWFAKHYPDQDQDPPARVLVPLLKALEAWRAGLADRFPRIEKAKREQWQIIQGLVVDTSQLATMNQERAELLAARAAGEGDADALTAHEEAIRQESARVARARAEAEEAGATAKATLSGLDERERRCRDDVTRCAGAIDTLKAEMVAREAARIAARYIHAADAAADALAELKAMQAEDWGPSYSIGRLIAPLFAAASARETMPGVSGPVGGRVEPLRRRDWDPAQVSEISIQQAILRNLGPNTSKERIDDYIEWAHVRKIVPDYALFDRISAQKGKARARLEALGLTLEPTRPAAEKL